MRLSHDFILRATGARCLSHPERDFKTVGSDSRSSLHDLLFVALKGDRFDGHEHLESAIQAGAVGLLIHDETKLNPKILNQCAVYVVPNTLQALQLLARAYRKKMKARIIGITGSNGKTTCKEFTAQIISEKFKTHFSVGSFNNHWGVPFSLLELNENHQKAVIEMGMNHSGEIADLVRIADPDVVLCTMVGRAHIENFAGELTGVAAAKEEIYLTAKEEAIRIFNIDQSWTREMHERSSKIFQRSRIITFSQEDAKADVFLKVEKVDFANLDLVGNINSEPVSISIAIFGSHNITNILGAVSVAVALGLSTEEILKGLKKIKTTWGRNQFVKLKNGAQAIFDGYNANPDSMRALLENSKLLPVAGKKVGVFGQMRELGDSSKKLHFELGEQAAQAGFNTLFFIGADFEDFRSGAEKSSFSGEIVAAPDYNSELGQELKKAIQSKDVVFLKASRGTRIERFFEFLEPVDFKAKT